MEANHQKKILEIDKNQDPDLTIANSNLLGIFTHNSDGMLVVAQNGEVLFANPAAEIMLGRQSDHLVGQNFGFPISSSKPVELNLVRLDKKAILAEMHVDEMDWEGKPSFLVSLHDVTARNQREQEMQAIISLSEMLRVIENTEEMFPVIIRHIWKSINVDAAALSIHSPASETTTIKLSLGFWADWEEQIIENISGKPNQLLFLDEPYTNNHVVPEEFILSELHVGQIQAIAIMPFLTQNETFGTLLMGRETEFSESEIRIFRAISNVAANAIHRANLLNQTEQRMNRLLALRAIDIAITSSMDLQITLNVCLEHVLSELKTDAACILLLNQANQMLEYGAGYGFNTHAISKTHIHLQQDRLGHALLAKENRLVSNVHHANLPLPLPEIFFEESFIGYYCIPLISKGVIKGALEIFHRKPLEYSKDWQEFANALGSQAAIAIDNATLFDELQRFSIELMLSYDATIEGWARAVSFRDSDTEGHTRRVTDLTLRLAKEMHFPESEMADLRRGAILHDIGKLAIPDNILRKPGPLTDEEWVIMKEHPQIAYDLLSQVPFLRSALDIPMYHHEKWDGSGYPKGLKGLQIPLSARIFAVADVWDALISDRPYRKAMSEEQTNEYILSSSGTHFDPQVVAAFEKLIQPARNAEITSSKPGVLIVDDEENIVASLKRALRSQYNIFTANTAETAMKIIGQNEIHVILTDQRMPEMTGLQLLKEAQKIKPDIVGLLISGYSDPVVLAEALNIGNVRGFISKPWDNNELQNRLLDAIDYQSKLTKGKPNSAGTRTRGIL